MIIMNTHIIRALAKRYDDYMQEDESERPTHIMKVIEDSLRESGYELNLIDGRYTATKTDTERTD